MVHADVMVDRIPACVAWIFVVEINSWIVERFILYYDDDDDDDLDNLRPNVYLVDSCSNTIGRVDIFHYFLPDRMRYNRSRYKHL